MQVGNDDAQDPLVQIRHFLSTTTCYDAMYDSSTLIILEANLLLIFGAEKLIKYALLGIPVVENGIFKALLGTNDILLLMHYFYHNSTRMQANEALLSFSIADVFELKRPSGLQYLNVSLHPDVSLLTAAKVILENNQFRAAIIDIEPNEKSPFILNYLPDKTLNVKGDHCILSVITNYRILRAIAINCSRIDTLNVPAKQLMTIPQFTAKMETPIISAIEMLISSGVNAIPILDDEGRVINIYGSPDILQFVADHDDLNLDLTIEHAISKRSAQFEGVHTCKEVDTLGYLLQGFKQQSVHRILVADENLKLLGVVRLVDIVRYLVYQE